jgi:hypothetical protein
MQSAQETIPDLRPAGFDRGRLGRCVLVCHRLTYIRMSSPVIQSNYCDLWTLLAAR